MSFRVGMNERSTVISVFKVWRNIHFDLNSLIKGITFRLVMAINSKVSKQYLHRDRKQVRHKK